jgi:hypothetical protein
MLVLLSRFLLAFCLALIFENWRQKIKIDDFFGSNVFGARATPDVTHNISVVLWQSVVFGEKTRVPLENYWPVTSSKHTL